QALEVARGLREVPAVGRGDGLRQHAGREVLLAPAARDHEPGDHGREREQHDRRGAEPLPVAIPAERLRRRLDLLRCSRWCRGGHGTPVGLCLRPGGWPDEPAKLIARRRRAPSAPRSPPSRPMPPACLSHATNTLGNCCSIPLSYGGEPIPQPPTAPP